MFWGRWSELAAEWSVAAVGAVLLGAAVAVIAAGPDGLLDGLEMAVPVTVGVGIVGAGLHLCRTHDAGRVARVAGWTVGGGILALAVDRWFAVILTIYPTSATVLAVNAAAIGMAAGGLVGYYESGLREREREMAAARSRFRALTEGSALGVITIDEDGVVQYANDAVERLFGYEPAALEGEPVTAILPEREQAAHRERIAQFTAGGDRLPDRREYEITAQRADGEEFPAEIAFGSHVADGRRLFTGVVRDVGDRKAAEAELRTYTEAVTQLHRIASDINAADDVAAIYDRTVEGATSLFDCDAARLTVRDGGDLVASTDTLQAAGACAPPPVAADVARESLRTGEVARVGDLTDTRAAASEAAEPYREDGGSERSRTVDCRSMLSVPLKDHGVLELFADEPAAFTERDEEVAEMLATHVGTAVERVEAQAEIRRERDRLDEFAGVLSHDIRNPLNVAMGRVTLAREADDPDEHLAQVESALGRIERLIEDALTLAREGARVGETERIDLAVTARDAWRNVATEDATLEVAADHELGADRSRLLQVFENLFRNAVEHGGPAVTVTVGATDDGFYVADDGPGIPEAEREMVFESGYSTGEKGTGYGLAIVERIVDAHGWTITATESEDGGARFEVTGVRGTIASAQ